MKIDFSNKVAVVTGGARGIGATISLAFAKSGARVIVVDHDDSELSTLHRRFDAQGLEFNYRAFDLKNVSQMDELFQSITQSHDRCDFLVNNARAGKRLGILEETEDNWDLCLDVGLKSFFFMSQAFIKNRKSTDAGAIVNISSVAAKLVTNEAPSYHACKAGVTQLTKYLSVAGGPHHVRANCVAPGLIIQDRHMQRYEAENNTAYRKMCETYQPSGSVGKEADVAHLVLFLCSAYASYLSGECIDLDGAATVQDQFGMITNVTSGMRT